MDSAAKSRSNRLAFTVAKRVASLLIPIGFGLGDFISAAKAAFVEAAAEHIKRRGGRPSTARIAVLTGLTRAEVARVRGVGIAPPPTFATQRTERVMHGWFTDPGFVSPHGLPKRLPMTGPGSFESLVQRYSGDIPRRALLEELLAGGMVRVTTENCVEAIRSHYLASAESESSDIDQLTRDAAVFFAGRSSEPHESSPIIRRVSVAFPNGIPNSVRKTIELRTERFLEALSDYLHSHVPLAESRSVKSEDSAPTLHVMIVQSELDSPQR